MRKVSLPQDVRKWVTEELNLQPQHLPHDSFFEAFKMQQDKEVGRAEGQGEAARRQALQREIEEMKVELNQLDCKISVAESQLTSEERSVRRSWAEGEESQWRAVLLQAYRQRCAQDRLSLCQDSSSVSRHCHSLAQLCRKAEVDLVFASESTHGSTSLGPTGPQPQVLREVRSLCEERLLFFLSLQESELRSQHAAGTHLSHEQREAAFQHWLSAVEDLLRSHPPSHILSALQHLASQQHSSLQAKLDSVDVGRDVAALRFRYDNKHLQDISREEAELPSVKSLFQDGWAEVEQALVQLERTRTQVQQQRDQLNRLRKEALLDLQGSQPQSEPLARAVFELELEHVMQAAVRDSVQEQCLQLGRQIMDRQEALRSLRSQWQSIMDFRQLVDNKQEQIHALIKANSNAKSELSRFHTEIRQFAEGTLGPQCGAVMGATSALHNSVSQEVKLTGSLSLAALNRRLIEGLQRVPADWLSISRLQSPPLNTLCQSLDFPLYRAPEQLTAQAVSQQLELRLLHQLLQLHKLSQMRLHNEEALLPAPDQQALLRQVKEADEELLQSLLPRVRELSQRSSQGLLWEQPVQYVLPEMCRGGLTLQKWLQRWRLAAKALE
ncbi:hypothetical protein JZ751_014230 [Albula glossodonta]|uniref:HAUS augmin-like complex subunit 5 n=1 Tax=Albula glossodonta TaxID=121402 RepID=A0A8T2NSS0_9TELE|nr:hypothetical protein JZ751_014230 [Albula glossodonta]